MSLFKLKQARAGYTIDQTVLIIALIAILVTIIVATVGRNLLTTAGGTKLSSQLRQVEDANSNFVARHGVFPHQAITATGAAAAANFGTTRFMYGNIIALRQGTPAGAFTAAVQPGRIENLLPGFGLNGTDATNLVLQHTNGGAANRNVGQFVSTGNRMVIVFENVPFLEAQRAEEDLDRNATLDATNSLTGRLLATSAAAAPAYAGTEAVGCGTALTAANVTAQINVNVCYVANAI